MYEKELEIKQQIDRNNSLIEESLTPNLWTLNNTVRDLLVENEKLQKKCSHKYDEDGFCVFCYKMKED